MEAASDTVLLLKRDRLTYYRTECTYPQVSTNNCSYNYQTQNNNYYERENIESYCNETPSFDRQRSLQ